MREPDLGHPRRDYQQAVNRPQIEQGIDDRFAGAREILEEGREGYRRVAGDAFFAQIAAFCAQRADHRRVGAMADFKVDHGTNGRTTRTSARQYYQLPSVLHVAP